MTVETQRDGINERGASPNSRPPRREALQEPRPDVHPQALQPRVPHPVDDRGRE